MALIGVDLVEQRYFSVEDQVGDGDQVRRFEAGFDDRTIADMLAQETIEMAGHYSRRADRTRKITGTVEIFEAEVNRRKTKTVKPSRESVKP